ncbi:MAG: potassium channel protein [Deltaproteobacteria bacterium]|nr:MAG: potassium channel protein [Deltaproteobacteria bacterium]
MALLRTQDNAEVWTVGMTTFPPTQGRTLQQKVGLFINHKYVDFGVIVMILMSVVLLVVEQFMESRGVLRAQPIFDVLNWLFTAAFLLELVLRWVAEKRKSRFFRVYWIDIIAVVAPMFRSLRFLRVLRLLRMFRLGKLLNRRFSSIQSWVHFGIFRHFWMIVILVTLIVAGAISFHLAEGHLGKFKSFGDTLWLVVFTVIGGEPLTGAPAETLSGRLIILFVMFAGLVTFAALTGIIAAVMINTLKPRMEAGDMDLVDLEDHIVICGWNRAMNLLIEVLQNSEEYKDKSIVLVAEYEDDEPESLLDPNHVSFISMLYVVRGDFTRTDILERAGIDRASEAIILADKCKHRSDQDRDARTILAALLIEKMNPDIFTCVEILNRENATHIKFAGVEEILVTDDYAGPILANAQRTRGLIPMLDELFNPSVGNQFYKIDFPPTWVGRTVGEVFQVLKTDYNATLISLEVWSDSGPSVEVNPDNDRRLTESDRMVVIATRYPILRD